MSIYNHFQSLALAVSKGHKAQRTQERFKRRGSVCSGLIKKFTHRLYTQTLYTDTDTDTDTDIDIDIDGVD